jgi:sterol 3beta-glucosyltransferase
MKIAIITFGTRGDIQPFLNLGFALKYRGHKVTIVTAQNYNVLTNSYGLNFEAINVDVQKIFSSSEGLSLLNANPFIVRKNINKWGSRILLESLNKMYDLALNCDKVIYNDKSMIDCFKDKFPNKMMKAMLVPSYQPTNEFPNPMLSGFNIPPLLNKTSYKFSKLLARLLHKPIRRFRRTIKLAKNDQLNELAVIYGISSIFLSKPKDLPCKSKFTGFWFGNSNEELTDDLKLFLMQGSPPLLFTFGSMQVKCSFDLQRAIIKIVSLFNINVIIVKGWGFKCTDELEKHSSIKIITEAPFEKLFPYVKAIVHHGGIGTIAECLRAGKPFFTCPILYPIGDQYFWGKLSYQKGVAIRPIPMKKLTEEKFVNAINSLITDQSIYAAAKKISTLLKKENGIQNAINEIESCR